MAVALKASNGLTIAVPDLDGALAQVITGLNPKIAKKVWRKGITAGGRILLRKARQLAPNSRVKRNKKSPKGKYGRSGILKKALNLYYRIGKNSVRPYVVIGADRAVSENNVRGNRTDLEMPSKTIHLVENGFTAVSRISLDGTKSGLVRGRDLNAKVLDLLRGQRAVLVKKWSINFKNALEQKLDQKLMTSWSLQENLRDRNLSQQKLESYIKGYKRATKTKVRARKFMERAAKEGRAEAVAKAVEILRSEYEKLLSIYRVK